MKLSFHGADRGVTGSCHLVECAGRRVLIDCGLYQGGRELEEENAEPFGFDPAQIDHVLLTHAHLDHCGRLPLLVKRGFRGEIICTAPTRELARLVMLDAAHLQEEEARHRARWAARRGREGEAFGPLYSILDALNTQDAFGRRAAYGEALEVAPGIRATFLDAGHILGSASILLELEEGGEKRSVLFSGDLGNAGRPLLRNPAPAPHADAVVMETTYGDRLHKPLPPSVEELYQAVADTFERYPAFYEAGTRELFREGRDPFQLPGLHFSRETADSVAINRVVAGAVIMAGSGMCTGGRVRHHLKHNLAREHCSVVFVGFAAHGTLARRIIDGAKSVRIYGEEIAVRARVYTINGFSAHADQAELVAWHAQCAPARTFLVHGDEDSMRAIAPRLGNTRVEMPSLNQQFEL